MPSYKVKPGLFFEAEVTQLRKLANSKCEDFDGFSIELFKWEGDAIGHILA